MIIHIYKNNQIIGQVDNNLKVNTNDNKLKTILVNLISKKTLPIRTGYKKDTKYFETTKDVNKDENLFYYALVEQLYMPYIGIVEESIKKEYFISEKPIYGNLDDMIKMVRKIGSKWCVLHGHPPKSPTDKPIGSVIKCFPTKEQAEKMHQAILISEAREAGTFKRKKIMIRKYGTSAGAVAAWDTRGRGSKEVPKTEPQPKPEPTKERGHLPTMTFDYESKVKLVAEDLGLSIDDPKVTDTVEAIRGFTMLEYKEIRNSQQNPKVFPDEIDIKKGEVIENYIDKAPKYDNPIFRGIVMMEGVATRLSPGQVVDMRGTSSWSSNSKIANKFSASNVIFVSSNVSKAVAISHLSGIDVEKEVIVSKDIKFEIQKVKTVLKTVNVPTHNHSGFPSGVESQKRSFTIVRVKEVKNKNLGKSFNIIKQPQEQTQIINDRIESDKYIDIYDKDGNLVYSYNPQPVKKEYFISEKPKKKILIRQRKIRKYGTSEGAVRAWDSRGRGQKEVPKKETQPKSEPTKARGHLKLEAEKDYDKVISTVENDIGANKKQAEEIVKTFYNFSGDEYKQLREDQRHNKINKQDQIIEDYIDKAPKFEESIYRGIVVKDNIKFTVGNTLDMKGTSSWTSDEKKTNTFLTLSNEDRRNRLTNQVVFKVENPIKAVSIKHMSSFPEEKEVLVSKKAKFVVSKIEKIKIPSIGLVTLVILRGK